MKTLLAAVMITVVGAALALPVEAKRLGGGKSTGMQRQVTPAPEAPRPPAAQPTQPAAATAAPAATTAKPAPGGVGRWLAPLAAFGLGAALMSMFGGSMLAGVLGNLLMILLLAGAAYLVFRMLRSNRGGPANQSMQYAGTAGGERRRIELPPHLATPAPVATAPGASMASRFPPGFDVAGFEREAKVSFIRMQAANDAGDVRDLRDYTTPELYAELAMQVRERGDVAQKTEVVSLEAKLLEVTEEPGRAIASVRFTGLISEEQDQGAQPVDETWHVVKDLSDRKGTWLVAGIQQNG